MSKARKPRAKVSTLTFENLAFAIPGIGVRPALRIHLGDVSALTAFVAGAEASARVPLSPTHCRSR